MAGSFTDYMEAAVLNHLCKEATFAAVTPYVALSTTTPNDDGTNFTEPSGNGYARVDATGKWPTATAGSIANDVAITFPANTGSNWGTVTHFAIFDAATSGNMLAWGELTTPRAITVGDTASFGIGALTITLT